MFKHTFYQRLATGRDAFLKRVAEDVAPKLGMADEWRGVISLTGSNSSRPGYLRPDMIQRIAEGARSPTGLDAIGEKIREVVKEVYGGHYDAVSFSTCEAALWASLETFAAPSSPTVRVSRTSSSVPMVAGPDCPRASTRIT